MRNINATAAVCVVLCPVMGEILNKLAETHPDAHAAVPALCIEDYGGDAGQRGRLVITACTSPEQPRVWTAGEVENKNPSAEALQQRWNTRWAAALGSLVIGLGAVGTAVGFRRVEAAGVRRQETEDQLRTQQLEWRNQREQRFIERQNLQAAA